MNKGDIVLVSDNPISDKNKAYAFKVRLEHIIKDTEFPYIARPTEDHKHSAWKYCVPFKQVPEIWLIDMLPKEYADLAITRHNF